MPALRRRVYCRHLERIKEECGDKLLSSKFCEMKIFIGYDDNTRLKIISEVVKNV